MRLIKVLRPALLVLAAAVSLLSVACAPPSANGCGPGSCAFAIKTSEEAAGGACPMMAIIGVIAPHPTTGLGLRNEAGVVNGVIWPFGYSARRDAEQIILFDPEGDKLARDGDRIQMAGWINFTDGVAHPCDQPDLKVIAAATS